MYMQMRWFIVLAGAKMFVYKREGQAEPHYVVEVKDFYSIQRFDEKHLIALLLSDKTRIPLSFDEGRHFQNFWFSFMATMASQRGMPLPRFVSKVTVKHEYWTDGALVLASSLGSAEKAQPRAAEVGPRGSEVGPRLSEVGRSEAPERRSSLPRIPALG
jgi:hypothetical protein